MVAGTLSNDEIRTWWRGAADPPVPSFPSSDLALPQGRGAAALARLVGDIEAFGRIHWGRRPLLRRRADRHDDGDEHFNDLFSLDALDEVVSAGWLRFPALRLRRYDGLQGEVIDSSRFTTARMIGRQRVEDAVDPGRVLSALNNGATLQLMGLSEMWPPLARLCRELDLALAHRVVAHGYFTPPSSQAQPTHFDPVDVFVLQFAGSKRWSVFEPQVKHPLEAAVVTGDAGPPCVETVLEAGDCLYIPRGFPHHAAALDALSGHITLLAKTITWLDIFDQLFDLALAELREQESFRAPLPIGYADGDGILTAGLAERLKQARQALSQARAAEAAQRTKHALWATRPPVLTGLTDQIMRLDELDRDTPLRRRPTSIALITVDGDTLYLDLGDRALLMPARIEPTIRWILSQTRFTLGEIQGLDAKSSQILVGRLILAGLLEAIHPAAEPPMAKS